MSYDFRAKQPCRVQVRTNQRISLFCRHCVNELRQVVSHKRNAPDSGFKETPTQVFPVILAVQDFHDGN